jgi:hypothetical protein
MITDIDSKVKSENLKIMLDIHSIFDFLICIRLQNTHQTQM